MAAFLRTLSRIITKSNDFSLAAFPPALRSSNTIERSLPDCFTDLTSGNETAKEIPKRKPVILNSPQYVPTERHRGIGRAEPGSEIEDKDV